MKRLAVVLFNLGGPDSLEAVQPFLFNLFIDPAIITAPQPFRWLLAKFISSKRTSVAREIYQHMGGRSPILELTQDQAQALQTQLNANLPDTDVKVFISMRYWHPFSQQTVQDVQDFAADEVMLLPLYPQYSTTTTESSFADWDITAQKAGLAVPTKRICCYPTEPSFVAAQAALLAAGLDQAQQSGEPVRVLFSAHGLPKKIVDDKADPYPHQIERGAEAIVDHLKAQGVMIDDWRICYQSRVGRLEWIGPATEDEIKRAGREGKALVVLPLAFVSEHSETLVELDIEYKELAVEHGITTYVRIAALGTDETFINGLSDLVTNTLAGDTGLCAQGQSTRLCSESDRACPLS